MREWTFKSFRPVNPSDPVPVCRRFPIRRATPFIGDEGEALAFARRACEHLNSKGVQRVEAWTAQPGAREADAITFRLLPIGNNWRADPNRLHHGGIWPDLDGALNYALFRGAGKLCRIEVLNTAGAVAWLVLVDQTANDPYAGMAPTWKQ